MDDPELFERALELPPERRDAAIREACGGNAERAARLLELVRLAAEAESTPRVDRSSPVLSEPGRLPKGAVVGRYVVASLLGQGAFGQVYEAFDLELERRVALKILRDDREATDQDERRFQREAQSLAQIDHPNVVRVYDSGSHAGRRYLTMELVDGTLLRSWLDASPARGWREVLETLLPAARGLQAAHEAGIVHRDFKPENVMIEASGRLVVTDFGIARVFASQAVPMSPSASSVAPVERSMGSTGSIAGTPRYMAPEQFLGRATPRSDQYAFCRVLAEALGLSGTRPSFDASTTDGPREPAHLELPGIRAPRWLRRVIERGLQPAEEHRHPDMAALIRAIERHRARRRWAVRSLGVVLAGIPIGYGILREPAPVCRQWDENEVRRAFQGTWEALAERARGAPHPASAAAQLAQLQASVEWNLGEWARARTATCEQHVNGLLDSAMARARDDCFGEWQSELQRRLEWTLEHPEALSRATLMEELPRNPTRCAYVDAPRVAQPGLDPRVRDTIAARLAEAQDERIHGDYAASEAAARDALRLADEAGHEAYRAEIHRRLGVLAARSREHERALELLQRSLLAAERLGLDALAAEAHASLAETIALAPSLPVAQAEQSLAMAQAKVARHGARHDELEADLLAIEGHIARRNGQQARAEAAYRRAAERYEAVNGPTDYVAAAMRANLARAISMQGRHEEAIALAEEALATRRDGIGAEHPLIAGDLLALGMLHVRAATAAGAPVPSRAHLRAAKPALAESARMSRALHGPRSLPVAAALAELTNVRLRLQEIDEAVAQDVRDFVDVYEDPTIRGATQDDLIRALRIARNFHHAQRAWPEALSLTQRLVELEQARHEPTPDPEVVNDELLLVQYLLKQGRTEEARRRLQAHERRYGGPYPNDAEHRAKLEKLRKKLDPSTTKEGPSP